MVAKHLEKLQKDKEEAGMTIVRALIPDLSPAVCALALAECDYDGKHAALLLQRFKNANQEQLLELQLQKKRKASSNHDDGSGDASSSSGSESSSDADSDSSGDKKRKRRSKGGKRSSKDKRKRSSKRSKDKPKKDRRKKKHKRRCSKRDASEERGGAGAVAAAQYGKYGIIRETDYDAKRSDFLAWAMEVKKVDPEVLPKYEEKELFKTYMEDYNTATLPHEQYYDRGAYELKQRAKAAKKGKALPQRVAFNDEEERRRELAAQRAKEQQERLQYAYNELKYTDKAQDMREQELLRAQMTLAYRTGDHAKAERLADRLRPDEPWAK